MDAKLTEAESVLRQLDERIVLHQENMRQFDESIAKSFAHIKRVLETFEQETAALQTMVVNMFAVVETLKLKSKSDWN